MNQRQAVHFYLNGVHHEVVPVSATQTVLQYLREQLRLTGTKEGCAEGDCGACTITEASVDAHGRVQFLSVNACIRFLPTLDGKVIWTVEGLSGADGGLHPVQQALVDHHGSQCGFCTPGFVMSLHAMYASGITQPSREQVLDQLSGNLCRCTGYRPIIDAAQSLGQYPAAPELESQVSHWLDHLAELTRAPLALRGNDGSAYDAPTSTDDLASLLVQNPQATVLAGGTDIGLWVTKQLRALPHIVYLGNVADLRHVRQEPGELVIGANVSLNAAWEAVVNQYPQALELWKRFASMPIRNSGTLVGNLANGSPIGDGAPLLMALGASVTLRLGQDTRRVPLEQLYLDYRKQDRQPGEFLQEVRIPLPLHGMKLATYKVSKRFDQDISAVCAAFALTLDERGCVRHARMAYGGMAATSRRAPAAEQALLGQAWNEDSVHAAMHALQRDFAPLSDMRASADYRRSVAGNLLLRFYLETTGVHDTRVSGRPA
jgi:xanthine dehydrogenase small subunit